MSEHQKRKLYHQPPAHVDGPIYCDVHALISGIEHTFAWVKVTTPRGWERKNSSQRQRWLEEHFASSLKLTYGDKIKSVEIREDCREEMPGPARS